MHFSALWEIDFRAKGKTKQMRLFSTLSNWDHLVIYFPLNNKLNRKNHSIMTLGSIVLTLSKFSFSSSHALSTENWLQNGARSKTAQWLVQLIRETSQSFVMSNWSDVIQKHWWISVGWQFRSGYCCHKCRRLKPPPIAPLAASPRYWPPQRQYAKPRRIRGSNWKFGRPEKNILKKSHIFFKRINFLYLVSVDDDFALLFVRTSYKEHVV